MVEKKQLERQGQINQNLDEQLLKYRGMLPPGLEQELDNMPWETIANLANNFKLKVERENKELRKLDKEIALTRIIIKEKIGSSTRGETAFDYKFLADLIHLLERMERLAIQYEVDLDEFMLFIYILIEKMKKERLVIFDKQERYYKPPPGGSGRGDSDRDEFKHMQEQVDEERVAEGKKK